MFQKPLKQRCFQGGSMKISVELKIDDSELGPLSQAARELDLTVDEYVLVAVREKLSVSTDPATDTEMLDYVGQAVEAAQQRRSGEQFTLGELCGDLDWWTSINPGDRKKLGKIFKARLAEEKVATFLRRRSDNHAVYQRISSELGPRFDQPRR
jgi:hypothetical protein